MLRSKDVRANRLAERNPALDATGTVSKVAEGEVEREELDEEDAEDVDEEEEADEEDAEDVDEEDTEETDEEEEADEEDSEEDEEDTNYVDEGNAELVDEKAVDSEAGRNEIDEAARAERAGRRRAARKASRNKCAEVSPTDVKRSRKESPEVNPTYVKRLWIDSVCPLRLPEARLPALQAQAERAFGIGPASRLVVLQLHESGLEPTAEANNLAMPPRGNNSVRGVPLANYCRP